MHRDLVRFRLGSDDLAQLRFARSPGHELVSGLRVLQAPGSHPLHWSWARSVGDVSRSPAIALLRVLVPPVGYAPDFLSGDPSWDLTPADEVARLRAEDPERVRTEVAKLLRLATGRRRDLVTALLDDPRATRDRVADAWAQAWELTMARHWDATARLLRGDLVLRSQRLAAGGARDVVASLHERVSWHRDEVHVRMRAWSQDVDCEGTGLLLVPSVLGAPYCHVVTEAPATPTLFYPAHAVGGAWAAPGPDRRAALGGVLGDGRARVLLVLDAPLTTSQVGAACSMAVSTASHHLARLRRAGLVDAVRHGGRVEHARTALGDALARA